MATITTHRFTQPGILRSIDHETLMRWLAPAFKYLESKGIVAEEQKDRIDHDKLAHLFLEPEPTMPEYLLDSVFLIQEMSDTEGMDRILEAQQRSGFTLDLPDNPTPMEVAMQAYMHQRDLLRCLHHDREIHRRRSFHYFVTEQRRLTPFEPPTITQLNALQERLDAFFRAYKRGAGCRVFMYMRPPEYWFIVQHGLPCKRELAIKDGESTVLFYRPQGEDIVVYDIARDELRIHACNLRELRVHKRAFGACLFGDAEYFRGEAKYTLQPLLANGPESLACADVKGMAKVTLVQVQFQLRRARKTITTCKSPDAFRSRERAEQIWPSDGDLKQASFMIFFTGVKKPRRLTLTPPNKLALSRDADATLTNRWLQARNFVEVSR